MLLSWSFSLHTIMHFSNTMCLLFLHLTCVNILGGFHASVSHSDVAEWVLSTECSSSLRRQPEPVVSLLWNRFQRSDGYVRRPSQGHTLYTTSRQNRYIRKLALQRRHETA